MYVHQGQGTAASGRFTHKFKKVFTTNCVHNNLNSEFSHMCQFEHVCTYIIYYINFTASYEIHETYVALTEHYHS